MLQFILRRLGLVIPTFIGITLLTFAFVHMIPGDPVMIMAGEGGISPERHAQLPAGLRLDQSLSDTYPPPRLG
ncbi:peptide ABC transporter permease, partial [Salmonella enterica]|uniref:peptide ABC transporter permease n=1 Tax=Salmonella enterica TaxID=28901 RepID=UPI0014802072